MQGCVCFPPRRDLTQLRMTIAEITGVVDVVG